MRNLIILEMQDALRRIRKDNTLVARPIHWQTKEACIDYYNGHFEVIGLDSEFPNDEDSLLGEWEVLPFAQFVDEVVFKDE